MEMNTITTGASSIATFFTGNILVSLMVVGIVLSLLALVFNPRLGMAGLLVVCLAGAGAAASPEIATYIYNKFHSTASGTVSL